MKILTVIPSEVTSPGGVHKTIIEISKHISKKGHDVVVLQTNPLNLPEEEIFEGFKIIRVKSRFSGNFYDFSLEMALYLIRHYKELKPDIIHVHGYHNLFSAEVIRLIKQIDQNVPIVFSPHFGIFSHNTLAGKYFWGIYNRFIGSKFIKKPIVIIAASNFEHDNINQILSVSPKKIKVIPYGIDRSDIYQSKKKKDIINLLYVGYLLELKGVHFIMRAIRELSYKCDVKVSFTIIGDGPYKKKLKTLAENLRINHLIKWEGFISPSKHDKLAEFYKNADVFLLLSQSENYGIVVPEALAMGTPVIVTKRTALKEFLSEPGCYGVDYPPNPEKVANLILKIYENKITVGSLTNKIRTWEEVSVEYEKIYFNLLNG